MFFSPLGGSKILQICRDVEFFTSHFTLLSKFRKSFPSMAIYLDSRSANIYLSNFVYMPPSFLPTSPYALNSKNRTRNRLCSFSLALRTETYPPQMSCRLPRSAPSSKSCSSSFKIHVSIASCPCSSIQQTHPKLTHVFCLGPATSRLWRRCRIGALPE
jgi:hypothetical protein